MTRKKPKRKAREQLLVVRIGRQITIPFRCKVLSMGWGENAMYIYVREVLKKEKRK